MTLFWIICLLLLVAALLFVVPPLWRGTWKGSQVLRDSVNLEIFRNQVAEMDADLRNGLLTPEMYEQGKRELQARLLEEVKLPEGNGNSLARNPHKAMAIALAILLPLTAVGLYWKTGNRDALLSQAVRSEAAIKELQNKLVRNPQDVDSLLALARSYTELERYADAAKVYDTLTRTVPNEAQLWADFADTVAMANGQKLAGHPTLLLNKALELDPSNTKALALAGTAAMERGDYPATIRYWEKLLKLIPADSEDAKMIGNGIQQARNFVAQEKDGKLPAAKRAPTATEKKPAGEGRERITGTVTLSAALAGKAKPDDMLFVLARAAEGPKPLLAVVRGRVKDLPFQFALDDSMAMSPQLRLSNSKNVMVIARISRSGDAIPQAGDLQGTSAVIKPGSSGVKIRIDHVVK